MSTEEHKKIAPKKLRLGIITVSTTRTLENDKSGSWISKTAKEKGIEVVFHQVVPDEAEAIKKTLLDLIATKNPDAALLTGGTGLSSKDVTIEAVRPLFHKELTAFGAIFSMESFKEICSAAIMSRATAGLIDKTAVFCMPGSINACKLACNHIIFPEIGHIAKHVHES
jgi:molybdenum cofactor biosynthesis protein B